MKMGKKVREYKAGDFIFAKVKGYPAWPARVQRMNGKKYFVYFYGTGEIANLPPNMIFDYAENKDKFLNKAVKRRDFNDGVKQIEYDFANNVPLEQVVGVPLEVEEGANNVNESIANDTVDESMANTTAADETMAEENATQNDTGIEDSDETGALVIDEGKQGKPGKKTTTPKTPAKETPKVKEPKTPRGRAKKDEEAKEEQKEDDKKDEELVSRSGRKIRPKRYIDEHTEENATLPSPAPKKRRGASPVEKEKENKEKENKEKNVKHFNAITQAELEDLKEPFSPEDPEKGNIIIAYLPEGQYIGIKLFQSRPTSFKSESARLQWDKQAARNALTLKSQLEKGHITPQSVIAQLVTDLNLTDEEKAILDKDRETEEKKSRVQFLRVEMKLIELDTKIKSCLCLAKADTELCLKLLDELMALDIKPLMLLKHPTIAETIKRMRAYVGNAPSWELSENAALLFSQHAHQIRKQADAVYSNLRTLLKTPEGLSFWEFFMERVEHFRKVTEKLTPDEILEMVHEPLEMSVPTSHTMRAAIDAANEQDNEDADEAKKARATPAKTKKAANNTAPKTPAKRQSSRNKPEEKDKEQTNTEETTEETTETNTEQIPEEKSKENETEEKEVAKDKTDKKSTKDSKANKEDNKNKEKDSKTNKEDIKNKDKDSTSNKDDNISKEKDSKEKESKDKNDTEDKKKDSEVKERTPEKADKNTDGSNQDSSVEEQKKESSKEISKETEKDSKRVEKERKSTEKEGKSAEKERKSAEKESKHAEKESKSAEKESKSVKKSDREDKKAEKEKTEDEPRAKRSRESKKTDPPPRSPTKRKSKF